MRVKSLSSSTDGVSYSNFSASNQSIDISDPATLSNGVRLQLANLDGKHWYVGIEGTSPEARLYTIKHELYQSKMYCHRAGSKEERVGKVYLSTMFSQKSALAGSWNNNDQRSTKILEDAWVSQSGVRSSQSMYWACNYINGGGGSYNVQLRSGSHDTNLILDCRVMDQDSLSIVIQPTMINARVQLEELLANVLAIFMRINLERPKERKPAVPSQRRHNHSSNSDSNAALIASASASAAMC